MYNLNNYILEKLHIDKNTSNVYDDVINICKFKDNTEESNIIKDILNKLDITDITDLYISSWSPYDELKKYFNNLDKYLVIKDDTKLAHKIIRNDNVKSVNVFKSKDKKISIHLYHILNNKVIGFCVRHHIFDPKAIKSEKNYTLYFLDDRD